MLEGNEEDTWSQKIINEVLQHIGENRKLINNILPIETHGIGQILRRHWLFNEAIKGQTTEVT